MQRAVDFADARPRQDWLAAHIALRLALERRIGTWIRGVPYDREPAGRPTLPTRVGLPAAATFSLSHTDRFALIAVAQDAQIGVDIEMHRPLRLSAPRIERLIDAGRGLIADATGAASTVTAPDIRAWTRLEAFSKARGRGIWAVLKDLDVADRLGRHEPGAVQASAAALAAAHELTVHDLDLSADTASHCAAIAIPSQWQIDAGERWLTPSAQAFEAMISLFE